MAWPAVPVLLLFISAALSYAASRVRRGFSFFTAAALFFTALAVNTALFFTEPVAAYPTIYGIHLNTASLLVAEITIAIGFLSCIYSYSYMSHERRIGEYYLLLSLFVATLALMTLSFNILLIYASFEASTVAGGILILFSRRRSSVRAALRFFAMSILGALIILAGILLQHKLTGSFLLSPELFKHVPYNMRVLLSCIYAIGFGVKVGVFPFGLVWLPPAHSEAPTPVSALLSGVMVQVAAFAVARAALVITPLSWEVGLLIVVLGVASTVSGALLAAVEAVAGSRWSRFHVGEVHVRGIKRIWAFSTVSEVGYLYIFTGLALLFSKISTIFLAGFLLHMLNHGMAKALLFYDSGVVIKMRRVEDLNLLRGLGLRLGPHLLTYLIAGFSLSLIPGTMGFLTWRELSSLASPPLWLAALVAAVFTFIACLYSWKDCFSGKPKVKVEYLKPLEGLKLPLSIPSILLAAILIILGVALTIGSLHVGSISFYEVVEEFLAEAAKGVYLMGG